MGGAPSPHPGAQASPGSTSPRTSTMCRGSWLTSVGGCSGSSMAGGAAFSKRSRRAGSFRGDTMEKWIPRYRREKPSGRGHGAAPPAAWAPSKLVLGSGTEGPCGLCQLPQGILGCSSPSWPGSATLRDLGVRPRAWSPHLPDLLHETLRGASGVRGALDGRQQVRGRVTDEEADAVCLATARDEDGCGVGGNRGPAKGHRPGASGGVGTPPHGHEGKRSVYRWGP